MPDLPRNLICATLLTGVYDVNRNERLDNDEFEYVRAWYDSINRLGLTGIIFHNTFSRQTVEAYQNDHVSFMEVRYDQRFNANVFRYLVYQDFIRQHRDEITNLFVTDSSDVEVVMNPFTQPLFLDATDCLFCGDEPKPLANDWMHDHSTYLRQSIGDFAQYEEENQARTLLNCGIIGGNIGVMAALMDHLARIHRTYTIHNQTPFTLDMGAFNYVARTQFADKLRHGPPVNTEFKGYEADRVDCWFRHK